MKTPIAVASLFLLSIAGALLEGLWANIPPALVQCNGLLLLLSALCLVSMGARALFDGSRVAAESGGKPVA